MDGPLIDTVNIVGLVAIVGFFIFMLRYRRPPGRERPERDLAYEWVAQRADRAESEFRARFGDDAPEGPDVMLIRIGFFNGGATAILPDQTIRPLAVLFKEGTQVLQADFAEALKSPATGAPRPTVGPARVDFPPFAIAPAGVVVFNIAVRGDARPIGLEGAINGIETVRRLG